MAGKWLSFLNSLWSYILSFKVTLSRPMRWVSMLLFGILLAVSFHAIASAQNPFLVQTPINEVEIVQKLNQAVDLSNRSREHQQQGEWQAAAETINASLEILENLPSTDKREVIYGQTLDILGQFYFVRGEFDLALKTWENSQQTYQNLGDRDRERKSYINQSRALQRLGLYDRACSALLVSTGLQGQLEGFLDMTTLKCRRFIQLKKVFEEVSIPEDMNQSPSQQEQYKQAVECDRLHQAIGMFDLSCEWVDKLAIALKIPDDSLSLTAGIHLGNVLRTIGSLEISLKVLEEVKQKTQSPEQIAKLNLSLGNTQREIGNRDRAYNDAKRPPSFEFRFCRQDKLGNAAYTQALMNYLENDRADIQELSPGFANAIVESQINYLSLALELGINLDKIKKLRSQLDYLQTIFSQNPQQDRLPIEYVKTLICTENPNWEQLRNQLNKVVNNAKQRQDWRIESIALRYIGAIYEQEYLRTKPENQKENSANKILDNAQKYSLAALKIAQPREREARDINYQIQWQLGRIARYHNNSKAAISHYQAAYHNLQDLRINFAAFNQEVQYDLRDNVEPVHRGLVSLLLRSKPTQEQLNLARKVIESLQIIELDSFLQDTCTKIDDVKIETIDKQAAVIYTIALPNSLDVIVSLPNGLFVHNAEINSLKSLGTNSSNQLLQQLEFIVDDLNVILLKQPSQNPEQYQKNLDELQKEYLKPIYDWLIKPFESYLEKYDIKTLVFALDGSLRSLPVAALYDGEEYLIKKYSVAVTPSLQLLEPRKISLNTLKVLAAGVETFSTNFPGWSDLQGVNHELEQIKTVLPTTKKLIDEEFTISSLREQINSFKFPIVHIATHGQFAGTPTKTFILSWDRAIYLEQLGQLLRVSDPTGLKDIELLIFSACQTAQGNRRATLGMAGVAFKAGARSIIGTLWTVQDESTALLMSKFYEVLQQTTKTEKNVNKAKSLRLAQLSLLEGEKYSHPHYWAPFILVGNWL